MSVSELANRLRSVSPAQWAIVVSIGALVVRLIYLHQLVPTPIFSGLSIDSDLFHKLALQILKGDWGYKDSIYLNEFYQFFLAFIYWIFGVNHLAVLLVQVLLDALSCLLIYFLASRAFNKAVGLLSGFIYAFYGIAIFYSGLLLDTTVTIFLQLLFLSLMVFGAGRRRALLQYLAAGAVFGCLLLARPNLVLFLVMLPLYGVLFLGKRIGNLLALRWLSAFLAGAFIILVPSVARHYAYFQVLSPFASHGGFNFYIGNNKEAEGVFMSPSGISSNPVSQIKTSIRLASKKAGRDLTPYEASSYWLKEGLEYLQSNPLEGLGLYLKKVFLFFRKEEISLNIDYSLSKELVPLFKLPFFGYGLVAPFCVLGILLSIRRAEETRALLLLYYGASAASVILFFISDRYRLPSVPIAILFCGLAVLRILRSIQDRQWKKSGSLLILTSGCFLVLNYDFEAITKGSVTGTHYNNLGIHYIKQGKSEKALEFFHKALEIDPRMAAAHNNLGQLHIERGEMETGLGHLMKALQLDPNYAVAHYNMGMALEKQGNDQKAEHHYRVAVDLSPNLAEARVNLGNLLMKAGDFAAARQHLDAAIAEDPSLPQALEALGTLQAKTGDLNGAVKTFAELLRLAPRSYTALVNMGLAYRKLGRLDNSMAYYRKAVESDPQRAEAYVQLGGALAAIGESDLAVAQYIKALEVDPRNYEACIKLGIERARTGAVGEAIELFTRAVSIRPDGEEARLNLVKAYLVKGDKEAASRGYEELRRVNPRAAETLAPFFEQEGIPREPAP